MRPYLQYYFAALTKYQVHPPFVFEFLTDVFEDNRFYHFFGVIENYRRNLLGNSSQLQTEKGRITTNQLVKQLAITPKIGEILFKSVHLYKPDTLLEIGNSLGISTLYQAVPNSAASMYTIIPDKVIAKATQNYFKQLGTRNIQLLSGDIEPNLQKAIKTLSSIEFLFFNGFWGKESTLNYFETCLAYLPPIAVFVFKTPYATKATTGSKCRTLKLSF